MRDRQYIAVDLGAESGRVMLATVNHARIALREMHRFPNGPVRVGKILHWDILRLWGEIQAGIGKAVAHAASNGQSVSGIGVDTWGVDFGLLDYNGELLTNPVHYRDSRTDGMPEKFFSRMPREKIWSITGIQTMNLNTLFQLCALVENRPALLEGAKQLLYISDLLTFWLCNRIANEYTIASTSQMLDARRRQYSPDILANIPIRPSLLPELVMPGTVLGNVSCETAAATQAHGVPVVAVGAHDTASAVAAVPARADNWLFLSSGTWSLLGTEMDQPVLSADAMNFNLANEGGVGGKIHLLKNIAGLWLLQECRRAWAREGNDFDYRTLVQLAREEPAHRALLDVEDPQMLAPGDMPAKIIAQCRRTGQNAPATPGQFTRVILESLAATYARVRDMIERVTGRHFTHLHIVGGGSQNDLLNQMAADATGLHVLAGPVEATAMGNVMVQAIATGQLDSLSAGRKLVAKTAMVREFSPHETEKWTAWTAKRAIGHY
ncbi:MAG: rhamnulokinase [Phycisphaerae bacterium]